MLSILGFGIAVVGALLFLRNQTGVLPTVPFAGFVVIAIGGLIIGRRIGRRSDPARQLGAMRPA